MKYIARTKLKSPRPEWSRILIFCEAFIGSLFLVQCSVPMLAPNHVAPPSTSAEVRRFVDFAIKGLPREPIDQALEHLNILSWTQNEPPSPTTPETKGSHSYFTPQAGVVPGYPPHHFVYGSFSTEKNIVQMEIAVSNSISIDHGRLVLHPQRGQGKIVQLEIRVYDEKARLVRQLFWPSEVDGSLITQGH